jgi:hypothetical protein
VLSDVFELRERITRQVVGSMVAEIETEEMQLLERGQRRFTEADDISWRAAEALTDGIFNGQPALAIEAIRLAEQAIEQDRNCPLVWYVLSTSHNTRIFFSWTQDRRGSLEAAPRAAEMLMTLPPDDSRSCFVCGQVEVLSGDLTTGPADQRRAHGLNPNDTTILFFLSWTEASAGNVDRAKALAAQAIWMSPKDRHLGVAHLHESALSSAGVGEPHW